MVRELGRMYRPRRRAGVARTVGYWAGAATELLARAPWRDLLGALALVVVIALVFVFMHLTVPQGWRP